MMHDRALDELRAATKENNPEKLQAAIECAIALIEQMSDQFDTLKYLAKPRFRAKSEKVSPGQLALELMGFFAHQQEAVATAPAEIHFQHFHRDPDLDSQKLAYPGFG